VTLQTPIITFDVWGDRALFTDPIFKAEMRTYEVPTRTAIEGLAASIYAKPQFQIKCVGLSVLKRGRKLAYRWNSVKSKASPTMTPIYTSDDRTQRTSVILCDVAYRVQIAITEADDPAKHFAIFLKRVKRGSCFQQPYLGCREFAAGFSLPREGITPIAWTEELGLMVTGLDRQGVGVPTFSRAWVENGRVCWEDY
jgi:CRISPR-associated protein Cas5d